MPDAPAQPADHGDGQRFAVLVTGPSEAALRRFLRRYVKPAFGMQKNQWRMCYRERYALTVLARPLRAGQDPEALYGAHAASGALVLACLGPQRKNSGHGAARAWLKARGFDPVVELELDAAAPESGLIDQGALVVNYVNARFPWRVDPIHDLDEYMAKNNKPFWA
jgi:hypothetical protein